MVPPRKEAPLPLPLKIQLLLFLDDFSPALFHDHRSHLLDRLLQALRAVLLDPSSPWPLKDQFMVSATSILISLEEAEGAHCVRLVELLLGLINRPNHPSPRAIPCECLRQLETAFPSLLSHTVPHLWSLSHSDRTPSSQSYILLFSSVLRNILSLRLTLPLFTSSLPLLPFTLPPPIPLPIPPAHHHQDLRRAVAFLLECPHIMTPCAILEFISILLPIALSLPLQPSMLKLPFSGMIHSYHPLLCHAVLSIYLHFFDSFHAQHPLLSRALLSFSSLPHHHLVFRLLPLHWLFAFPNFFSSPHVTPLIPSFYPTLFDPLALKALKLDLLAFSSLCLRILPSPTTSHHDQINSLNPLHLFQHALVSVSSSKCLPPTSAETAVMFRTLHKFVVSASSHSDPPPPSTATYPLHDLLFSTLEVFLLFLSPNQKKIKILDRRMVASPQIHFICTT